MDRTKLSKPGGKRREAERRAKKLALRVEHARAPEPESQNPGNKQEPVSKTNQSQKRLPIDTESRNAQIEVIVISSSSSEASSDDDDDAIVSVAGRNLFNGNKSLPRNIRGMAKTNAILISDDEDGPGATGQVHTKESHEAMVILTGEHGSAGKANVATLQIPTPSEAKATVEGANIQIPLIPTEPKAMRRADRSNTKNQADRSRTLTGRDSPGADLDNPLIANARDDLKDSSIGPRVVLDAAEKDAKEQAARKERIKKNATNYHQSSVKKKQRADEEVEMMDDMLKKGSKIETKMERRVAQRRAMTSKREKKAREKKERKEQREANEKNAKERNQMGDKQEGTKQRVMKKSKEMEEKPELAMRWDPYMQAGLRRGFDLGQTGPVAGIGDVDCFTIEAIVAITSNMQRILESSAFDFTAKHDPEFAAKIGTAHGLELHIWVRDLAKPVVGAALYHGLCRDEDKLLLGKDNVIFNCDKWSQCMKAVILIRHTATHRRKIESAALIDCIGAAVHLLDAMRDEQALEIANKLQILMWATQTKLERETGALKLFIKAALEGQSQAKMRDVNLELTSLIKTIAETSLQAELDHEVPNPDSDIMAAKNLPAQTASTGREPPSEEGEIHEVSDDLRPEAESIDVSSISDLMAMVLDIKADICAKLVKHVNKLFDGPSKIHFRVTS